MIIPLQIEKENLNFMKDEQLLRYSRHIFLKEIDIAGQTKLLQARVLIVGLGGLGSPVALYLAASGVGQLVLADRDIVELSNLQRQIIHDTHSVGQSKTQSAQARLQALNPDVNITLLENPDEKTLVDNIRSADIVVDASDNFATRFVINAACVQYQKPLVSGAAIGFQGQLAVFDFRQHNSPCYHCLYPDQDAPAVTCRQTGVIAPLVGMIGSMQALETLKLLLGCGQSLHGQLVRWEGLNGVFHQSVIQQDLQCGVCQ